MTKNNLAIRFTTAGLVIPVLLAVMYVASPWVMLVAVLLAAALATFELFRMTHAGDPVAQVLGVLATVIVAAVIYCFGDDPRALLALLFVVPITGVLVPLWRLGDITSAALRMMTGVAGPLYIGGLLSSLALLQRDHGPHYVFLTLTLSWMGDTGAYFLGRFFGKTKLYAAVSPKKTRAGFLGALLGAAAGALVLRALLLPELPIFHALVLGVASGALGQLGDLVESLLKRSTGIKDSGTIVPGHGGLLDRIDAVLIVGPLVYLYATWFGG